MRRVSLSFFFSFCLFLVFFLSWSAATIIPSSSASTTTSSPSPPTNTSAAYVSDFFFESGPTRSDTGIFFSEVALEPLATDPRCARGPIWHVCPGGTRTMLDWDSVSVPTFPPRRIQRWLRKREAVMSLLFGAISIGALAWRLITLTSSSMGRRNASRGARRSSLFHMLLFSPYLFGAAFATPPVSDAFAETFGTFAPDTSAGAVKATLLLAQASGDGGGNFSHEMTRIAPQALAIASSSTWSDDAAVSSMVLHGLHGEEPRTKLFIVDDEAISGTRIFYPCIFKLIPNIAAKELEVTFSGFRAVSRLLATASLMAEPRVIPGTSSNYASKLRKFFSAYVKDANPSQEKQRVFFKALFRGRQTFKRLEGDLGRRAQNKNIECLFTPIMAPSEKNSISNFLSAAILHIENFFSLKSEYKDREIPDFSDPLFHARISNELLNLPRMRKETELNIKSFIQYPIVDEDFWGFGVDSPSVADGVKLKSEQPSDLIEISAEQMRAMGVEPGRGALCKTMGALLLSMSFDQRHLGFLKTRVSNDNFNRLGNAFARHISPDLESICRFLGKDIRRHPSLSAIKQALEDDDAINDNPSAPLLSVQIDESIDEDIDVNDDDTNSEYVDTDDDGIDFAAAEGGRGESTIARGLRIEKTKSYRSGKSLARVRDMRSILRMVFPTLPAFFLDGAMRSQKFLFLAVHIAIRRAHVHRDTAFPSDSAQQRFDQGVLALHRFKFCPRFRRGVYVPVPASLCDEEYLQKARVHAKIPEKHTVVEVHVSLPGRNVFTSDDDGDDEGSNADGCYISILSKLPKSSKATAPPPPPPRDPTPLFITPMRRERGTGSSPRPPHLLSHLEGSSASVKPGPRTEHTITVIRADNNNVRVELTIPCDLPSWLKIRVDALVALNKLQAKGKLPDHINEAAKRVCTVWSIEQMDTFTVSDDTHMLRKYFRSALVKLRYESTPLHHSHHHGDCDVHDWDGETAMLVFQAHVPLHLYSIASRHSYALKLAEEARVASARFSSELGRVLRQHSSCRDLRISDDSSAFFGRVGAVLSTRESLLAGGSYKTNMSLGNVVGPHVPHWEFLATREARKSFAQSQQARYAAAIARIAKNGFAKYTPRPPHIPATPRSATGATPSSSSSSSSSSSASSLASSSSSPSSSSSSASNSSSSSSSSASSSPPTSASASSSSASSSSSLSNSPLGAADPAVAHKTTVLMRGRSGGIDAARLTPILAGTLRSAGGSLEVAERSWTPALKPPMCAVCRRTCSIGCIHNRVDTTLELDIAEDDGVFTHTWCAPGEARLFQGDWRRAEKVFYCKFCNDAELLSANFRKIAGYVGKRATEDEAEREEGRSGSSPKKPDEPNPTQSRLLRPWAPPTHQPSQPPPGGAAQNVPPAARGHPPRPTNVYAFAAMRHAALWRPAPGPGAVRKGKERGGGD
eukprot:TRINITY_DN2283_c0_g1_i1.p1 TRINITY_DN2283_c0_g1~~TRINITY_DN2283_c0_g1_i1.p1  ORF type:complete len:1437 (-),score=-31.36 TRINITY_DN2283_c0_g1_i1:200-4489(-)